VISGVPGNFTATDREGGTTVHAATLEDLLAAAHAAIDPAASGFTFRWTRLIAALPV
jgi:hypothetical protein